MVGERPPLLNRPFPSSKKFHFQNEAKCETFVVKMSFICIIIKNHFHVNGFALSLALKVRFFGTRKWPIILLVCSVTAATIQATVGIRVLNKTSEEYWFLMNFNLSYLDGNVDLPYVKKENAHFLVHLQIFSR